jgi:thioesterase domain-containing protein
MGVRVAACDQAGATLIAPLTPNVNHRSTVFGGSASAAAILAAWTWLNFSLRDAGEIARLVIQRNTIDYLAPISDDFEARCDAPDREALARFIVMLRRRGKARIALYVRVTSRGVNVATFRGDYVALRGTE